jgi:hypothetical protein
MYERCVCPYSREERSVCVRPKKHEGIDTSRRDQKIRGERRDSEALHLSIKTNLQENETQHESTLHEREEENNKRGIRFKVKGDTTREYTTREGRGKEWERDSLQIKKKTQQHKRGIENECRSRMRDTI